MSISSSGICFFGLHPDGLFVGFCFGTKCVSVDPGRGEKPSEAKEWLFLMFHMK